MSISDALMYKYYELLTECDLSTIKNMHPKLAKSKLAQELVSRYHSKEDAEHARLEFERIFARRSCRRISLRIKQTAK